MAQLFHAPDLIDFAARLAVAAGVPPDLAQLTAESLVAANLRGVDSHGLQQLPFYLDQIAQGRMDPVTRGAVRSESGACMLFDGQNGIGQGAAAVCCDHALRLARAHGIALVVARDSNHYGAAGFWTARIAAAGCLGISMCNAGARVAPWQGRQPRVGTNPISMCVPGPNTWHLDMATTTVAFGKIIGAANKGQAEIPAGWAMDKEGRPTTNTQTALQGLLMPLGGYKGSGLALMAEILCGVLGGGAMTTDVGDLFEGGQPRRISQMFLAVDVSRFMPLDQFVARMRALVDSIKSSQPAAGFDEVLVAGDPEWRMEQARRAQGIPLTPGVWQKLQSAAARLGVATPRPVSA
ncbi:MAG TPA: Ldh family oxidoreductase [Bryobacteraceae bacterium]|nr:Ldh family oxidoreductase [Bryobacteraceae bacterium]